MLKEKEVEIISQRTRYKGVEWVEWAAKEGTIIEHTCMFQDVVFVVPSEASYVTYVHRSPYKIKWANKFPYLSDDISSVTILQYTISGKRSDKRSQSVISPARSFPTSFS